MIGFGFYKRGNKMAGKLFITFSVSEPQFCLLVAKITAEQIVSNKLTALRETFQSSAERKTNRKPYCFSDYRRVSFKTYGRFLWS